MNTKQVGVGREDIFGYQLSAGAGPIAGLPHSFDLGIPRQHFVVALVSLDRRTRSRQPLDDGDLAAAADQFDQLLKRRRGQPSVVGRK